MILEAIATQLKNANIKAFPLVGEQEAELPFSVFSNIQTPINTKDGPLGYRNSLVVTAMTASVSQCVSISNSIRLAIMAITGTINSTTIEDVMFIGGDPVFDEQLQIYRCDNEFLIGTKNT